MRQAALGVERAVDRVDHHERVRAAEVDGPALLADGGEAQRPASYSPASCVEDRAPRRRRRSPACGRRPPRGSRPRARARRSWAGRGGCRAARSSRGGRCAASRCPGRDRGQPPGLSYGGVADPPPARGHRPRRAARCSCSAARAPARRPCCASASRWLVREGGLAPESILVLTVSEAGAAALRERLESSLDGGFDELTVTTVHDFCARLLHDEALEAGLDPFAAPVTPADRIAMLLERIDELPLRLARPARQPERAARLDRRPHRPPQGRARLARGLRGVGGDARRPRPTASASSPPSTRPTTGCSRRAGRSTSATCCSTPSGSCARSRACGRG